MDMGAKIQRVRELDDRAYCVPRLVLGASVFERVGWITGLCTRSAFSGAANVRGPLEDRIHDCAAAPTQH